MCVCVCVTSQDMLSMLGLVYFFSLHQILTKPLHFKTHSLVTDPQDSQTSRAEYSEASAEHVVSSRPLTSRLPTLTHANSVQSRNERTPTRPNAALDALSDGSCGHVSKMRVFGQLFRQIFEVLVGMWFADIRFECVSVENTCS